MKAILQLNDNKYVSEIGPKHFVVNGRRTILWNFIKQMRNAHRFLGKKPKVITSPKQYMAVLIKKVSAMEGISVETKGQAIAHLEQVELKSNVVAKIKARHYHQTNVNVIDIMQWSNTPQGHSFWSDIQETMHDEGMLTDSSNGVRLRWDGLTVRIYPNVVEFGCQIILWDKFEELWKLRKREMDKARKQAAKENKNNDTGNSMVGRIADTESREIAVDETTTGQPKYNIQGERPVF